MENKLKDLGDLQHYQVTEKNPLMIKLTLSHAKKLYHYTTKEAANSIIKNNCFWVTRSDHLADKSEIKYIAFVLEGVIKYLEKEIDEYKVKAEKPYALIEPIIKTLQALKELYEQGGPFIGNNIFLLSLSESKNNKYLINNYCGKEGCILELKNNIDELFPNANKQFATFTAKIEYDYGKQMELIIGDINEFFYELHVNLVNERVVDYPEILETIRTVIYAKIINYSFFFKNSTFSKEEEYRTAFLVSNNNMIKYRLAKGKPLSYFEAEIANRNLISKKHIFS